MVKMSEFDDRKEAGERRQLGKARKGPTMQSRSCYAWSHGDKVRHVRRVADRHSHHRRRNHVRSLQARDALDAHTTPLPSSGKRVGDSGNGWGHSWNISNKRSLRDA